MDSTDTAQTVSLVVGFLLIFTMQLTEGHFGRGTDFVLAFPDFVPPKNIDNASINMYVIVFNPTSSSVTVNVSFPKMTSLNPMTKTLTSRTSGRFELDRGLRVVGSGRHSKGIKVEAKGAQVEVQALSEGHHDSFQSAGNVMALPLQALSAEYIVATHCSAYSCFVTVVIVEDRTVVNVHLRVGTPDGVVEYQQCSYVNDDVITAAGDVGDVIQVTCNKCDLSGTLVTASQRVAVIAGGQFTSLTSAPKDAVVEQTLPWETAGRFYVLGDNLPFLPRRNLTVKVITGHENTTFCCDQTCATSTKPREMFTFAVQTEAPISINASHDVVVGVFLEPRGRGDEVMVLPLPLAAWSPESYEVGVAGRGAIEVLLVLITEANVTGSVVVSVDGVEHSSILTGAEAKLGPGVFVQITSVLPILQDYILRIACDPSELRLVSWEQVTYMLFDFNYKTNRAGQGCGRFHGYVYARENRASAWTLPLMPTLTIDPSRSVRNVTMPSYQCPGGTTLGETHSSAASVTKNSEIDTPFESTTSATVTTLAGNELRTTWSNTYDVASKSHTAFLPTAAHDPETDTSSPTHQKLCPCPCPNASPRDGAPRDLMDTTRQDLALDVHQLSRTKRAKTSAPDRRWSVVFMGLFSVAILVGLYVWLFLSDVRRICSDLTNPCRKGGDPSSTPL